MSGDAVMGDQGPPYLLLLDDQHSRHFLVQTHTEELKILPGRHWVIQEVDGHLSVTDGAEARWCEEEFGQVVVTHPQTQALVVVFDDGRQVQLSQYRQEHETFTMPLKGACADPFSLDVVVLKHRVSGNKVLFSLPRLYDVAIGKSARMTASAWYQSWWPWWTEILLSHHLDNNHLRKPVPRKALEEANTDSTRFLDFACISAHALIILLTKWATPTRTGKPKDDATRQAWLALHHAFMNKAHASEEVAELPFFIDPAAQVESGLPIRGNNLVVLPMLGRIISVYPLLQSEAPFMRTTIACLQELPLQDGHRVEIGCLLCHLERAGKTELWVWRQLAHGCAQKLHSVIEDLVLAKHSEPSRQQPPNTSSTSSSQDVKAQGLKSMQADRRVSKHTAKYNVVHVKSWTRQKLILKHWYALRHHFDKAHLTVAFDASRVGGVERMIGIIGTSNHTAWLPPQACRVSSGHPPKNPRPILWVPTR